MSVFASTQAGQFVIFDDAQTHWLEDVPPGTPADAEALHKAAASIRSIAHSQLSELFLREHGDGGADLHAEHVGGRHWHLPIAAPDVPRLKELLANVDRRLAEPQSVGRRRRLASRAVAAVALGAVALPGAPGSIAVPAVVGLLWPGRPQAAGLAVAALAAAALAFRTSATSGAGELSGARLLAGAGAAILVLFLFTPRLSPSVTTRQAWRTALLLLAAALASALPFFAAFFLDGTVLRLHAASLARPGATALLLGAAAALAAGGSRTTAWTGRVLAVAALIPLFAGTQDFVRRMGHDRLLFFDHEEEPAGAVVEAIRSLPFDHFSRDLRISPDGRWFAARQDVPRSGPTPARTGVFYLGSFQGERAQLSAEDVAFLDASRIALVESTPDGLQLVIRATGTPDAPILVKKLPDLAFPHILPGESKEPGAAAMGGLRVTGIDPATGELLRVASRGEILDTTRWVPGERNPAAPGTDIHGDGDSVLSVTQRFERRPGLYLAALPLSPWRSELRTVTAGERKLLASSALDVRCFPPAAGATAFPCAARGVERTYLWSVETTSGSLSPLLSIAGRSRAESASRDGRLALFTDRDTVLVDVRTKSARRLRFPAAPKGVLALALEGDYLAILDAGAKTLALYRVPAF